MSTKIKIKLFEDRGEYIRYDIYKGKTKLNSGWYKGVCGKTKGVIAKEIKDMYFNKENLEE